MIENGKCLVNGNNPHLQWLYGRVEDVTLRPPYALVTAGQSLHWMDWNIVLPRLQEVLLPNGYLAIIEQNTRHSMWHADLAEIIPKFSTNKKYEPYELT